MAKKPPWTLRSLTLDQQRILASRVYTDAEKQSLLRTLDERFARVEEYNRKQRERVQRQRLKSGRTKRTRREIRIDNLRAEISRTEAKIEMHSWRMDDPNLTKGQRKQAAMYYAYQVERMRELMAEKKHTERPDLD